MSAQSVKGLVTATTALQNSLNGTSGTSTTNVTVGASPISVSPGTGAGQCNEMWSQTLTFVANTPQTLDLTGLTGEGGRSVSFSSVSMLDIRNADPANSVAVGDAALAAPVSAPTASAAGSSGTLAAGTYLISYTWVDANGETTRSPDFTLSGVTLNQTITVTLPALPTGATGSNVYVSTVGGNSGTETKQNLAPVAGTTFAVGTINAGTAPPTSNTCANNSFAPFWSQQSNVETIPAGGATSQSGANVGNAFLKTNFSAGGWAVSSTSKLLKLDPGPNALSGITVTIVGRA